MRGTPATNSHTSRTDLLHTYFEGVAFDQRVGGDVAKLAASRKETLGAKYEPRSKIHIALDAATIPALQRSQVVVAQITGDLLATAERRVAEDRVEAGLGCIGENFRESQRPVQRQPVYDSDRLSRLESVMHP